MTIYEETFTSLTGSANNQNIHEESIKWINVYITSCTIQTWPTIRICYDDTICLNTNTLFGQLFGTEANIRYTPTCNTHRKSPQQRCCKATDWHPQLVVGGPSFYTNIDTDTDACRCAPPSVRFVAPILLWKISLTYLLECRPTFWCTLVCL